MRVSLDKESRFLAPDGKVDLKQAFIYSGIKAAWCYKQGSATPETIRGMSEENLIRMGVTTFISDHGTPDEHYEVSIEVTGIPKLLCMILNNEKQYTADERSLRYTKVQPSEYISEIEVDLYNKWLKIFTDVLWERYRDFFLVSNKGVEDDAKKAAGKIAQENARNFVSVLTPTSISYTAPWYQWQKLYRMLEYMVENPNTELKRMAAPYAKVLMSQLVENRIVVTTKEAIQLYPPLIKEIKDGREILYRNNKHIKLSLWAVDNPFSGIDRPNEFGSSIKYSTQRSISSFAQIQRHRTSDCEAREPEVFSFVTPEFIKGTMYEEEYKRDMLLVSTIFPQGQMIDMNIVSSIRKIIDFMGKERACDRAQWETQNFYVNELLPAIVDGLKDKPEYADLHNTLSQLYLNRCRCGFPDYDCPTPCGHPRVIRPF